MAAVVRHVNLLQVKNNVYWIMICVHELFGSWHNTEASFLTRCSYVWTVSIIMIRLLIMCCGWLEASVIDSSTWVVGGSDSSVAVETNSPWLAGQSEQGESLRDSSNTC